MKRMLLACLLLCVGIAAMSVILWRYADSGYYCADAVECTFQALEMKAAGTLFPSTWHATNFAHLQALPLRLGFAFSSSFVVANRLCVFVMYGLSLLSLILLWKKGLRDKSGLLLMFFYTISASGYVLQQLFSGAFYAQFAIAQFLLLAAWMAACFAGGGLTPPFRFVKMCVALCATFLCCALMGTRMVAVICLPVMGGIVWLTVFDRSYAMGNARRWLLCGGIVLAAGVAIALGCAIYGSFVGPAFGVPTSIRCASDLLSFVPTGSDVAANLGAIAEGVLRMLDFPFGREMTCPRAFFRALGCAVMLCLCVVFPILETRDFKSIDAKSRFLIVVSWLSVSITVFILAFGRLGKGDEWNMSARYLLLPGILLMIIGTRYACRTFFSSADGRYRLVAAGLVLALLASFLVRWFAVRGDHRTPWREVLQGLRAERLDYGYATYENALLPWFYSDDTVRIPHVVVEEGRLAVPGWSMSDRWYEEGSHNGTTFLMLTDEELLRYAPNGLGATALGNPSRKLLIDKYHVLVYDFNIAHNLFGAGK